ncbi:MAG TPA: 2-dehydropantoate 2-reductase, partial [Dehalococcoidales bacterium]
MKIIIYGAGGIGSVVGGHLWRAGHAVILIGRDRHVSAIHENGLKLVTPAGIHFLRIPAVTDPEKIDFGPDDVIFLCMKGQDTEKTLVDLSKIKIDLPVFCLQNGIRNEEIAARYFQKIYGVMIRIGAEYLSAGEVTSRRDPPGWLIIGRYPQGSDEVA